MRLMQFIVLILLLLLLLLIAATFSHRATLHAPVFEVSSKRDHHQSEVPFQTFEPLLRKIDFALSLTRDEPQVVRRNVRIGVAKRCCCCTLTVSLIAFAADYRKVRDPPLTGIVATPNSWSRNQQSLQSRVLCTMSGGNG